MTASLFTFLLAFLRIFFFHTLVTEEPSSRFILFLTVKILQHEIQIWVYHKVIFFVVFLIQPFNFFKISFLFRNPVFCYLIKQRNIVEFTATILGNVAYLSSTTLSSSSSPRLARYFCEGTRFCPSSLAIFIGV